MITGKTAILAALGIGAGGLTGIAFIDPDPPLCSHFALPRPWPVMDGVPVVFRLSTDQPSVEVRMCPTDGEFRIYDERAVVGPEGLAKTFRLPEGTLAFAYQLNGGDIVSNNVLRKEGCPGRPFEMRVHVGAAAVQSTSIMCPREQDPTVPPTVATPLVLPPDRPGPWIFGGSGLVAVGFALRRRLATVVAPVVFAYSRVLGPKVLDQAVRSQIHQVLAADPGLHASEIMRRVEAPWSTTAYHLRVLAREGVITVHGRHYFPTGHAPPAQLDRILALRDPGTRRVYDALEALRGPAAVTRLARAAGLSSSGASKAVRRLERVGLVVRERHWRTVWVHLLAALP